MWAYHLALQAPIFGSCVHEVRALRCAVSPFMHLCQRTHVSGAPPTHLLALTNAVRHIHSLACIVLYLSSLAAVCDACFHCACGFMSQLCNAQKLLALTSVLHAHALANTGIPAAAWRVRHAMGASRSVRQPTPCSVTLASSQQVRMYDLLFYSNSLHLLSLQPRLHAQMRGACRVRLHHHQGTI